jgi:hypothetical protein
MIQSIKNIESAGKLGALANYKTPAIGAALLSVDEHSYVNDILSFHLTVVRASTSVDTVHDRLRVIAAGPQAYPAATGVCCTPVAYTELGAALA